MIARNPTVEQESLIRDRYYYHEGLLRYRYSFNRCVAGEEAGVQDERGYKRISVGHSKFLVHRIIWFLHYDTWPTYLDHKNQDKSDNRIENLRPCNFSQNKRNVDYKLSAGTRFKRGKWESYTRVHKKYVYLGRFETQEQAIKVRQNYLRHLYGDFHYESNGTIR